ncbi:branched-chain-amino-acid transaminase [Stomatohabitans albus]|uniref:branched-chain-amino-acid transaminase n=1 Tax=Stomatohabitans albus TaxID=3110766 RepID=UPI00300D63AA
MAGSFGTTFAPLMAVSQSDANGVYEPVTMQPFGPISLSPAAHVLHYGSACFEGLKAHRGEDGVVRLFRLDAHVNRLVQTASLMHLPHPPAAFMTDAIYSTVQANLDAIPAQPDSAYVRPMIIGTEPNIGAAGHPSTSASFMVLVSPVGQYFSADKALRIAVETELLRTTPMFGRAKAGANYALALPPTMAAEAAYEADQVLFAPGGDIQETGASNVMVFTENTLITPPLSDAFLHGVTRDSIIQLARDNGMTIEERHISVDELVSLAPTGEVALTGTAAIMAPVGTLIVDGQEVPIRDGKPGDTTTALRAQLRAIQQGTAPDTHGWLTPVTR